MAKSSKSAKSAPIKVYILLDKSSSMTPRWGPTMASITAYVQGLAANTGVKAEVDVYAFSSNGYRPLDQDNGYQFTCVRANIPATAWKPGELASVNPLGNTPLFDAVGDVVEKIKADPKRTPKSLLVVMTDGEENCSRRLTQATAKQATDSLAEFGVEVVHLGVDFNAYESAGSYGVDRRNTVNYSSVNYSGTMSTMASKTAAYARGSVSGMSFTDAEKKIAETYTDVGALKPDPDKQPGA